MTLTEFKRMAQKSPLGLELLWRYGKTEFPPWLQGVRPIVAVRSYGFDLAMLTTEGLSDPRQKPSRLPIERASLFKLEGDILSVYSSGCRPATEDEQEALDSWAKKVEKNPNVSYWSQKEHFRTFANAKKSKTARKKGYEYLIQNRRREIDPDTGRELIFDKTVRGGLALKYRVHYL